jgi:hypothetical protein
MTSQTVSLTLRFAVIALAIHGAFDLAGRVFAQEEHRTYVPVTQNPGSLEERVAELEYKLQNVVASTDAITVTGANLYVVNGTGTTDGEPNGLGNLIIGYNELREELWPEEDEIVNDRTGSHMIVVGSENNFSREMGIVVGRHHTVDSTWASAIGGIQNTATGLGAVVVGGRLNLASGMDSVVSGGNRNEANGPYATVTGGEANLAQGITSSVSGGSLNRAHGASSSISGGQSRTVSGEYNWAAGSLLEER